MSSRIILIQTLTNQVIASADTPQFDRVQAAKAFWSLASKLVAEPISVQHDACMSVLPVIKPLVTEKDEIKIPVLKGLRDLCQILTLHDFLIKQGLLDVLISTVETPQTKKPLEACLFCLSALAGNNNEPVATQVVARILNRLANLLLTDSPTIVASVLALIIVLALYRNLVPVLHAEPHLVSRIIALQEEGVGPVKSNASIAKARLMNELKESPVGPIRVRSAEMNGEEASSASFPPSTFDALPPGSSNSGSSVAAIPVDLGAIESGQAIAIGPVAKERRPRDARQRSLFKQVKESDIIALQDKGLSLEQARRSLAETNSCSEAMEYAREHYPGNFEQLTKIHILDAIYGEPPPILLQQRSLEPLQKTSSAGFSHGALCPSPLSGEDSALLRKASLPKATDDPSLRRAFSRDRPDGPPRSKSNDQEILQRRDSRRREDDKPTRAGSGEQRRREPRKVSGEEQMPMSLEGERVANLDKAFANNGKWPDGVVNLHLRETKASTLPNKKHGNFDVAKKRKEDDVRVDAWLRCYGFGEYSNRFAAQKITYETLLLLTMEDLEELGVHTLGDRKSLIYQISKDVKRLKSKQKRLETKENDLHIAVLQSNPLNGPESPGFPNQLDLRAERSILCDSFRESGRQIRVRFAPATSDNLLKLITKGCQALHISGHGDPRNLMLEDGKGGSKELDVATLRNMLEVGGNELQFVFISACFSATAANAFVEAGVPHVIAVQESVQITDTSARSYARHVYMALCLGLPVEKAFAKGQAAVLANGCPKPCCCAHLHSTSCTLCPRCRTPMCCTKHGDEGCHVVTQCCAPQIPHDESLKFLLLPPQVDHNVKLFEGVSLGHWVNCTPDKIINNLPSIPDHFSGRSKDMFCVVQTILKPSRLTTIVGPAGVGKSALARAAASYVHDRRHFEGGCFLVKLTNCTQVEQIVQALLQAVESGTPPKPTSVATEVLHRSALYVFDDCDEFMTDSENQKAFKDFVQAFLERHAQATVLMTSQQSVGRIDGLTHRILTLGPLHQLDSAALFLNRIPRDLKNNDFGDSDLGSCITSLHQLARYPLFPRLKGNPRLVEWCAEMLNHMSLCDLNRCLSIPTGQWPMMSEAARLLLLRIKACVMISYRPQPDQDQQKQVPHSQPDPQLQQIRQLQSLLGLTSSLSPPLSPSQCLAPPTLLFPPNLSLHPPLGTPAVTTGISPSSPINSLTPTKPPLPLHPSPKRLVRTPSPSLSPMVGPTASFTSSMRQELSEPDNSLALASTASSRTLDNLVISTSETLPQTSVTSSAFHISPFLISISSPQAAPLPPIGSPLQNPLQPDVPDDSSGGRNSTPSRQDSVGFENSLSRPGSILRNSPPSRPPPPTSAARHKRRSSKPKK